jgi:hypothetical protein
MRLGNAVFASWIVRLSFLGADPALTGDAALQLRLNFVATALLERIGATAGERCARDHKQDRQGPHPLILGMKLAKANRRL